MRRDIGFANCHEAIICGCGRATWKKEREREGDRPKLQVLQFYPASSRVRQLRRHKIRKTKRSERSKALGNNMHVA